MAEEGRPAAGPREELARLLADARALESMAEVLRDMVARTQAYLAELRAAGSVLENLAGREGAEILVPIGAGSFIWAKVARADRAIVSLGANVSIEVDVERAKEIIGERSAEAEKALRDYMARLADIERALQACRERIRALAEAASLVGGAEEGTKEGPG